MSEPDQSVDPGEPIAWDDTVDVICVGDSPGVSGYAAICLAAGFDVVTVEFPAGGPDQHLRDYLAAMTADLDGEVPPQPDGDISARPVNDLARPLDPFVGERLRLWAAGCLSAPSGVLFTAVPDHVLTPMRTDTGELITGAAIPADPAGPTSYGTLIEPVYEYGRIVGALLADDAGRHLVRSEYGLAFGIGPVGPGEDAVTALVGRPAGRFARLQGLEVVDEGDR